MAPPVAVVPYGDLWALIDVDELAAGPGVDTAAGVVEPTPRPVVDVDTGGAL